MTETRCLKNVVIFVQKILGFVLSIKIINIDNDIAWKYGNVTVKEENYCKPVKVSNFWSNNYTEYKSNDDENKMLSVIEYFDKIRSYLIFIINKPKKSDMWNES